MVESLTVLLMLMAIERFIRFPRVLDCDFCCWGRILRGHYELQPQSDRPVGDVWLTG